MCGCFYGHFHVPGVDFYENNKNDLLNVLPLVFIVLLQMPFMLILLLHLYFQS